MNRFLFICILTTLALFSSLKVKAQFDVHFTQYWDLKGFYNPAWAGQTDKLNISGTYSMQMMNFTHAPRRMYFGADMPFSLFNKQHGVGAGFFNEVYRWALSMSPLILQIFISEKTNRMIRLFLPSNKVVWGLIWG